VALDPAKALDLLDQVKTEAVCDPADPPNECSW